MTPWLIPVSGFLGAGKTTLILTAAEYLASEHYIRSAIILNDQGEDLVDTAFALQHHLIAEQLVADQVTGGCFCCRFSDLLAATDRLRAHNPRVIFIEPVGSCTDLNATILNPLRRDFPGHFRLTPITAVIDPAQTHHLANPDIAFLYENQLAEADLFCLSKSDLHHADPTLPAHAPILRTSAKTGDGIADWLDALLLKDNSARTPRTLHIDYTRYAAAEAALAWLNYRAELTTHQPITPAQLVGQLLDDLTTTAHFPILHLKLIDETPQGYLKAAWTGMPSTEPSIEGTLDASPTRRHRLLINLRAIADPREATQFITTALNKLPATRRHEASASFRPSPPQPEQFVSPIASGPFRT